MTQLELFGTPPTPAATPDDDEYAPVNFRLYGNGWPCPHCQPIPTYWPTPDIRDRHTQHHRPPLMQPPTNSPDK